MLAAGLVLPGARSVFAQSATEPFRFGLIKALTGRVASAYAPLYVPARIAVDEINAAGGILGRKVEIVDGDDEGTPAKEPAVVRALMEQKIDILLGPVGTSPTLTALSVTNPAKFLETGGSFAAEAADGKTYPYHFQFNFNNKLSGGMTVDYISANLKDKKIGIIQESFASSEAIAKTVTEGLKANRFRSSATKCFRTIRPTSRAICAICRRRARKCSSVSTGIAAIRRWCSTHCGASAGFRRCTAIPG